MRIKVFTAEADKLEEVVNVWLTAERPNVHRMTQSTAAFRSLEVGPDTVVLTILYG